MSLNKAIEHGKEKRDPVISPDSWCRNNGGCSWCLSNRMHSTRKRKLIAEEKLKEAESEMNNHKETTVHRDLKYGITLCVNLDETSSRERYFTLFDSCRYSSAGKVIHISFDEPKYVFCENKDNKADWILNPEEKKELIEILNKPSEKYTGFSVWEAAKFEWNTERMKTMINAGRYKEGEYDSLYIDEPCYVPLSLTVPDYTELKYGDLEIAEIGRIAVNNSSFAEVFVNTDDSGTTPHFHIRKYDDNSNYGWETSVKFTSSEYYVHHMYKDKLPGKKLAAELDKMLRSMNPKDPGRTYWQTAIVAWNCNNSGSELPFGLIQPDYTKLR